LRRSIIRHSHTPCLPLCRAPLRAAAPRASLPQPLRGRRVRWPLPGRLASVLRQVAAAASPAPAAVAVAASSETPVRLAGTCPRSIRCRAASAEQHAGRHPLLALVGRAHLCGA
jgi:hypothetical protein